MVLLYLPVVVYWVYMLSESTFIAVDGPARSYLIDKNLC